jgi:hypothetical protein
VAILGPVVDLLASEGKPCQATPMQEPVPGDHSSIDLLAELEQLVKSAGAFEGAGVIEAKERNRADKLHPELDGRAALP